MTTSCSINGVANGLEHFFDGYASIEEEFAACGLISARGIVAKNKKWIAKMSI